MDIKLKKSKDNYILNQIKECSFLSVQHSKMILRIMELLNLKVTSKDVLKNKGIVKKYIDLKEKVSSFGNYYDGFVGECMYDFNNITIEFINYANDLAYNYDYCEISSFLQHIVFEEKRYLELMYSYEYIDINLKKL